MKLLYPALSAPEQLPLGEWKSFDEVKIDELSITGYEVQIQGLAQAGGFDRLVAGARAALQPSLEPAANAAQTA